MIYLQKDTLVLLRGVNPVRSEYYSARCKFSLAHCVCLCAENIMTHSEVCHPVSFCVQMRSNTPHPPSSCRYCVVIMCPTMEMEVMIIFLRFVFKVSTGSTRLACPGAHLICQ